MKYMYKKIFIALIILFIFLETPAFSSSLLSPRDKLLDSIKLELEIKYNQWGINNAIDKAVDESIDEIEKGTGYWEKIVSKFSSKKAIEFAEIIGELIFANNDLNNVLSDYLKDVFKDVSDIVLDNISELYIVKIKKIGIDIEKRYGTKVESLFFKTVKYRNYMLEKKKKLPVDFTTKDILKQHIPQGISIVSGVILLFEQKLIIDKIASHLENTIFKKINVNILQTSFKVASWALVVIPIVYEFITPNTTILEIAKQYKSFKVKDKIREGFINYILDQIDALYPQIVLVVQREIDTVLNDFQKGNKKLLECYENVKGFKEFTDNLTDQGFNNIVLFIGKTNLTSDQYTAYLENKTFYKVANIPPSIFDDFLTMIDDIGIDKTLKWYEKIGDLHNVLSLGLYKTFNPDEIDQDTFKRLLNIKSKSLLSLLKELKPEVLKMLFNTFSNTELEQIAKSKYYDIFLEFTNTIKGRDNLKYFWTLLKLYPSEVIEDKDIILAGLERENTQNQQRKYLKRLDKLYHWKNVLGPLDVPFLREWIAKLFVNSSLILKWVGLIIALLILLVFIKIVWKILRFLWRLLVK